MRLFGLLTWQDTGRAVPVAYTEFLKQVDTENVRPPTQVPTAVPRLYTATEIATVAWGAALAKRAASDDSRSGFS